LIKKTNADFYGQTLTGVWIDEVATEAEPGKPTEAGQAVMQDVSKYFTGATYYEQTIGRGMIEREGTPAAITYFAKKCGPLSDYMYWFYLSTLWVSYTGHSDINAWKSLFGSSRAKRKHSIMKPSEVRRFESLPHFVTVYRAHRPGETDWIAYTMDETTVKRFAAERGVTTYSEYRVKKRDILAVFLRRGEHEVIILDQTKPEFVREWSVNA